MSIPMRILLLLLLFISSICEGSETSFQSKEDSLNIIAIECLKNSNHKDYYKVLKQLMGQYEYQGNWGKHDSIVNIMIEHGEKHNLSDFLAESYNFRAMAKSYQGLNSEAIYWFKQTLNINQLQNEPIPISNSLENIAQVYGDMGIYDSALTYQLQSLRIREQSSYPRVFNNYTGIAIIYSQLNDIESQKKYLDKAKEFLAQSSSSDLENMTILHNLLGEYYNTQSVYDSALFHFGKVYEYSQKVGWKRAMAVGLGNMAKVYNAQGNPSKALQEHLKTLQISLEIEDASGITEQYSYISNSYLALNNLSKAKSYAILALQKAREHGFVLEERNALEQLAAIFEKIGQHSKALDYHKQFHTLNDSLQSIEKVNHIAELEKKFETEQKEHQIGLLSAENEIKNQRIKLGFTVITLLLVALFLGVMLYIQRQRTAKALEADLQQKLSRSQMNPHFVSNAMSSIQSFMYKNNAAEAAKYLGKFAHLNRAVLEHSLVDSITLEEEIVMLTSYLDFERMRHNNAFSFELCNADDLDTEMIYIPPLFIQPFVENAIKHGVKDMNGDGEVAIRFTDCEKYLKVEIVDNGKGVDKQKVSKDKNHKSRSTEIVSKRLKLLRSKYKDLPKFTITNNGINVDNGVTVTLYLPIL
jgi:tetratricopeptide (TPR) repeat protein